MKKSIDKYICVCVFCFRVKIRPIYYYKDVFGIAKLIDMYIHVYVVVNRKFKNF